MTLEQLKTILAECLNSYGEGCYDIDYVEHDDKLSVVEEGDWTQDHKYQQCTTIIKDSEGNFFALYNSRSGSYHTDWYYGEPYLAQVKRVEKVVTTVVWEEI